jgi:prevent-host-death family protein
MRIVNIHAAKTHFSCLVADAAAGEEILIAKAGVSVARLVSLSLTEGRAKRRLGALAGVAVVPPDVDAPLPEDVIDAFEGH